MPRYYFHLRTPRTFVWDEDGIDLPDPATAQGAAERSAAELRGGLLYRVDDSCTWTIAVTDEGGRIVHMVSL
jgi:Domain of unknown function (DUF6894)